MDRSEGSTKISFFVRKFNPTDLIIQISRDVSDKCGRSETVQKPWNHSDHGRLLPLCTDLCHERFDVAERLAPADFQSISVFGCTIIQWSAGFYQTSCVFDQNEFPPHLAILALFARTQDSLRWLSSLMSRNQFGVESSIEWLEVEETFFLKMWGEILKWK